MPTTDRKLRVFLCHASQDKPIVRELQQRLLTEGWIDPWLDEEKLLPGQDFDLEIYKATRDADAIIICLSKISVVKEGYVNKEIRRALNIAQEKLEGAMYVIPLRLDECNPSFEQLKKLHWVDYFKDDGYEKLKKSLAQRFGSLHGVANSVPDLPNDLYKFIYFPAGPLPETQQSSHYQFWISKYPVTNIQYERFLKDPYFNPRVGLTYKGETSWDNRDYWGNLPMFEKSRAESKRTDLHSGNAGRKWVEEQITYPQYWTDADSGKVGLKSMEIEYPRHWTVTNFGIARKNVPVVGVTWYEASGYCKWLEKNWYTMDESKVNKEISLSQVWIRLPTRNEWEVAAGGKYPSDRYPWDKPNVATHDIRNIFSRANVAYQIGMTTPVDKYPMGASPRGVMDMSGNVWEWLSNIFQSGESLASLVVGGVPEDEVPSYNIMEMIGGSWSRPEKDANLSGIYTSMPDEEANDRGFRVVIAKM